MLLVQWLPGSPAPEPLSVLAASEASVVHEAASVAACGRIPAAHVAALVRAACPSRLNGLGLLLGQHDAAAATRDWLSISAGGSGAPPPPATLVGEGEPADTAARDISRMLASVCVREREAVPALVPMQRTRPLGSRGGGETLQALALLYRRSVPPSAERRRDTFFKAVAKRLPTATKLRITAGCLPPPPRLVHVDALIRPPVGSRRRAPGAGSATAQKRSRGRGKVAAPTEVPRGPRRGDAVASQNRTAAQCRLESQLAAHNAQRAAVTKGSPWWPAQPAAMQAALRALMAAEPVGRS